MELKGVRGSALEEAPFEGAELIVIAVPSRAFGEVVAALPPTAPC